MWQVNRKSLLLGHAQLTKGFYHSIPRFLEDTLHMLHILYIHSVPDIWWNNCATVKVAMKCLQCARQSHCELKSLYNVLCAHKNSMWITFLVVWTISSYVNCLPHTRLIHREVESLSRKTEEFGGIDFAIRKWCNTPGSFTTCSEVSKNQFTMGHTATLISALFSDHCSGEKAYHMIVHAHFNFRQQLAKAVV